MAVLWILSQVLLDQSYAESKRSSLPRKLFLPTITEQTCIGNYELNFSYNCSDEVGQPSFFILFGVGKFLTNIGRKLFMK